MSWTSIWHYTEPADMAWQAASKKVKGNLTLPTSSKLSTVLWKVLSSEELIQLWFLCFISEYSSSPKVLYMPERQSPIFIWLFATICQNPRGRNLQKATKLVCFHKEHLTKHTFEVLRTSLNWAVKFIVISKKRVLISQNLLSKDKTTFS